MSSLGKFFNAINPLDMFNANQMQKLKAFHSSNGIVRTTSEMFNGYFSGSQLSFGPSMSKTSQEYTRKARVGASLGLAAYGLSQTVFADSAIENVADFAVGVGMHGAITSALYKKKPGYGIGYGAWAGLNIMRRGNQLGPF